MDRFEKEWKRSLQNKKGLHEVKATG